MTKLRLTLNETKTKLKDARAEHFDLVGYTFGPYHSSRDGHRYRGAGPSKKSVGRLKTRVGEILFRETSCHGTRMKAYRVADTHVQQSVRHFLCRRHKVDSPGTRRFPVNEIYGTHGVLYLSYTWRPCPLRRRQGPSCRMICDEASRRAGCRTPPPEERAEVMRLRRGTPPCSPDFAALNPGRYCSLHRDFRVVRAKAAR